MISRRRRLPPLNALRPFEAAPGVGGSRERAAEAGGPPGATSRPFRWLADWLGPPALFQRLGRRVDLTPTGAALLAETGPALDRLATAAEKHHAREGKAPPA